MDQVSPNASSICVVRLDCVSEPYLSPLKEKRGGTRNGKETIWNQHTQEDKP